MGYICCRDSKRGLSNPVLYWFGQDGNLVESVLPKQQEGRFEIEVPKEVRKIYIVNQGYSSQEISLGSISNQVLVYLHKV